MKKWLAYTLGFCILAGILTFTAPEANAASHEDHCVCGGSAVGVGDHAQCETEQWKPLSGVVTLTSVNWMDVPSGHYYLDGNVTVTAVTDGNAIGQVTRTSGGDTSSPSDDVYALTEAREISLCLNGYSITTTKDRVFKGVYMDSVLNICDCSGRAVNGIWQWDGDIVGGTSNTGGIAYTYANSTVNIYGGNLKAADGQTVISGGGLFYVAQDRSAVKNSVGQKSADYASSLNIYNGNLYGGSAIVNPDDATKGGNGGNIYVAHYSNLNVYGGYIHDGSAERNGGNIHFNSKGTLVLQNANIYNGTAGTSGGNVSPVKDSYYISNNIYGGYPECVYVVTIEDGQEKLSHEYSLSNALKNVPEDSYLKLTKDLIADTEISGDVAIDMNGYDLSGVTVSGTVYGFDSATDSYTGDQAGKLIGDVNGQILPKEQYLMLNEEGYSFHRYNVEITHLTLKPAYAAMGYKARFDGDEAIARNVSAFGYEMWLEGCPAQAYSSKDFVSGKELTLRLQNILSEDNTLEENLKNAQSKIYAKAFIRLNDATKVSCGQVSYDFKEMLDLADEGYTSYNADQKAALQDLAAKFSEAMMTWDVPNLHHAAGGMWTAVDNLGFLQKLTENGSYYDVKEGSYVLTSDVKLANRTMRIKSGTTVNICLNGHTIEGTKRMMRIYGTLNLCDCHASAEEGSMTSSFTDESGHGAVFYTYYGSVFNLYGGNLKATGTLATSGVGAVSHEDQDGHPNVAPGVMNMYGGSISGGKVEIYTKDDGTTTGGYGGLLSVFHGATFNMYGGELYGGQAEDRGGAINVSDASYANLYGGSIYDCTAHSKGGTIYVDGGSIKLSGAWDISDLYLSWDAAMDAEALSADARVGLRADVHGLLSGNTALKDSFLLEDGYEPAVVNGRLVAVRSGVTENAQTEDFRVGYSSVCINPAVAQGVPLSGFGNSANRLSTEIQEDLYVSATAITDADGNTVLLITSDLQRPQEAITDVIREHISLATGVPFDNIYLSASHSHSTPDLYSSDALIKDYKILLYNNFTQAAVEAMASRVPATVQAGATQEVTNDQGRHMNFSRHYYYYDDIGEKQYWGDNFGTAPSSAHEDSLFHVAQGDHSLQLIRFVREGEKDVILGNWAAHPTMTGGSDQYVISADYVGPLRDKVQAETDCYFAFVQGAAGNMNPKSRISEEKHNLSYDAYGEAIADFVIAGLEAMETLESGKVQTEQYVYTATVQKHSDEELARAKELLALPYEERKEKCAEYGFTSTYHASSVIAKANMGDTQALELNVFCIGDSLAFYSLPGELWAGSALRVKGNSDFKYTFTVGYTNGDWKYFPDGEAADMTLEGGYENYEYFYSRFVLPETTKEMIAYWEEALGRLYENVK